MKTLVYEPSPRLRDNLIKNFIQNGFELKIHDHLQDCVLPLKSGEYSLFLCHYRKGDDSVLKLIENLREDPSLNKIRIFLHSEPAARETFTPFIRQGINGIILKPYVQNQFMKYFFELLHKNDFNLEKRKHIRVSPAEDQKPRVLIKNPQSKRTATGVIINISIGGMLIKPFGSDNLGLTEKSMLQGMQITIGDMKLACDGLVIAAKNNLFGLAVFSLSIYDEQQLCNYIYDHINVSDLSVPVQGSHGTGSPAPTVSSAADAQDAPSLSSGNEGTTLDRYGNPKK